MDPDHVKLLAEQAAWAALEKDRRDQEMRVEAAVTRGIEAFFNKHEIKPEHWLFLRLQLKEREDSWGIVKRTVIALLLVSALTFGGLALWEKVTTMVLAADHRNGPQRQQPTTDGP